MVSRRPKAPPILDLYARAQSFRTQRENAGLGVLVFAVRCPFTARPTAELRDTSQRSIGNPPGASSDHPGPVPVEVKTTRRGNPALCPLSDPVEWGR
ncbi:hypothetical protein GCM10009864_48700 [Streptomyces lunalinharesii]|uniref:Uncharacterized protein n=1 Tax=Streptomyces lunalinharesii TaxID=333384 RepID=A0ABP6ENT0_9ACTN